MNSNQPARAWVFAGGDFSPTQILDTEVGQRDIFVCVDRGLEHCLSAGFQPTLLIGDLDSVSQEALSDRRVMDVPRQIYPSKKAVSDLNIALELLCEQPPQVVVLLGVSGGRTDHMLFNWHLPLLRQWPFRLQLIDATSRCTVLQGDDSVVFDTSLGQTISLLPLTMTTGVDTMGLKYALNKAALTPGSTRGLSNVAGSASVRVGIEDGTLLVIENTETVC